MDWILNIDLEFGMKYLHIKGGQVMKIINSSSVKRTQKLEVNS